MKLHEEAWSLLRVYLDEFPAYHGIAGSLSLCSEGTSSAYFLRAKTWIRADLQSASPNKLAKLRAFIEIVSQLSQSVDFQWRDYYHSFWKDALVNPLQRFVGGGSNPTEFDSVDQLMKSNGSRFILDLTGERDGGRRLDILRNFLFMDPQQALGVDHARILSNLTMRDYSGHNNALANENESSVTIQRRPIAAIELGLHLSMDGQSTAQFRAQFQLLEDFAEHEHQKRYGGIAARFEVTTLWLAPSRMCAPMELTIMAEAIGSEMTALRHLQVVANSILIVAKYWLGHLKHLVRAVFPILDIKSPLRTLRLRGNVFNYQHMAAVCSPLRHANSLTELEIRCVVDEDIQHLDNSNTAWAWIAFGIFHSDSEARLDHLSISRPPLKPDDIEAFESVIRTPHPGRYLWILEHGDLPQGNGLEETPMSENRHVFVQLKPKTKFKALPKARSQVLEALAFASAEFEVALQLETWICVVLPGWRFGWVPSASAVSRREVLSRCSSSDQVALNSNTTPLAIVGVKAFSHHPPVARTNQLASQDSVEALKHLLQLIGHSLEELNHSSRQQSLSESDLAEILDACPNLRHINLMGSALESIQPLADQFETEQCQIASLNVQSSRSKDLILAQLAELLERPSSRTLRFVAASGVVKSTEVWTRLERALASNRTLQYLYLYSVKREHRELVSRIHADFQGVVGSKTPVSTKIAFISVINAYAKGSQIESSSSSSLGKLDSNLTATIFAFAGIPITRTIFWLL